MIFIATSPIYAQFYECFKIHVDFSWSCLIGGSYRNTFKTEKVWPIHFKKIFLLQVLPVLCVSSAFNGTVTVPKRTSPELLTSF